MQIKEQKYVKTYKGPFAFVYFLVLLFYYLEQRFLFLFWQVHRVVLVVMVSCLLGFSMCRVSCLWGFLFVWFGLASMPCTDGGWVCFCF